MLPFKVANMVVTVSTGASHWMSMIGTICHHSPTLSLHSVQLPHLANGCSVVFKLYSHSESSITHLAASVEGVGEAVYSELLPEDDNRPSLISFSLPLSAKTASANEVEDDKKEGLILLEEEQFIRTATGLTIASRTTIKPPRLDRLVCGVHVGRMVWSDTVCVSIPLHCVEVYRMLHALASHFYFDAV